MPPLQVGQTSHAIGILPQCRPAPKSPDKVRRPCGNHSRASLYSPRSSSSGLGSVGATVVFDSVVDNAMVAGVDGCPDQWDAKGASGCRHVSTRSAGKSCARRFLSDLCRSRYQGAAFASASWAVTDSAAVLHSDDPERPFHIPT